MEVASAASTILLQSNRKQKKASSGSAKKSGSTPDQRNDNQKGSNQLMTDRRIMGSSTPAALRVELDGSGGSRGSTATASPQPILTPPPEEHDCCQGPSPSPSGSGGSGDGLKEKRAPKRPNPHRNEDEVMRKSNRITRNREDPNEVVNNYVDSKDLKQPRRVVPPIGARRQPFQLPKLDLEKEKDRLRIHMVGPKTRTTAELPDDRWKPKRKPLEIGVGIEFQAEFPEYLTEDFVQPQTSRDYVEDRDELVWRDSPKTNKIERELDDAWTAIRRQFGGKIGLDAMMSRLMRCGYDIDEMLKTIELEQFENLSQPFEKLNVGQQREFERLLRKAGNPNGKHREGEKIFRQFQEKFMKTYYIGEIVQYYYETKRSGCFHQQYTRCDCRDGLICDLPVVPRTECVNCTRYIWEERCRIPQQYCAVCEMYYARNRKHRTVAAGLFEEDEHIAIVWRDLEKENGRVMLRNEVLEWIEAERRAALAGKSALDEVPVQYVKSRAVKLSNDAICSLSQKYQVKPNSRCSLVKPWGKEVQRTALAGFTPKETISIVKAFQKVGLHFDRVAAEVGSRSERDIAKFYQIYKEKYRLDQLTNPAKKEPLAGVTSVAQPSPAALDASASPTPEPPTSRRKRGGSADPSYSTSVDPPAARTTRRTRQSCVTPQAPAKEL